MAISATTVWEIRSAGTSTGGGGFVSGGTDRSQQDAVHAAFTDLVIDGTTATDVTSSVIPFASDDVGNIINITSGTGFTTGRYEVKSVTSTVATLDRAVGTLSSTGGNGVLGGAMTLLDTNVEDAVAGNKIYIKADGTHTLTSAIDPSFAGSATNPVVVEGYNTTRGDAFSSGAIVEANRPLIAAGANSIGTTQGYWQWYFLNVTSTASQSLRAGTNSLLVGCKVNNSSVSVARFALYSFSADNMILGCEGQSLNGVGLRMSSPSRAVGCYLHDCGDDGVLVEGNDCVVVNTVIDTCTLNGIKIATSDDASFVGLTIYNCATGIEIGDGSIENLFCNIVIDNCTTGINQITAEHPATQYLNINFSNNTTDKVNVTVLGETTLAPGFADAANGDFAVGANMQGKGFPQKFPGELTTSNLNLGAAQVAASAGVTAARSHLHPIEGGV